MSFYTLLALYVVDTVDSEEPFLMVFSRTNQDVKLNSSNSAYAELCL